MILVNWSLESSGSRLDKFNVIERAEADEAKVT